MIELLERDGATAIWGVRGRVRPEVVVGAVVIGGGEVVVVVVKMGDAT